jgi:hypothetical protein
MPQIVRRERGIRTQLLSNFGRDDPRGELQDPRSLYLLGPAMRNRVLCQHAAFTSQPPAKLSATL